MPKQPIIAKQPIIVKRPIVAKQPIIAKRPAIAKQLIPIKSTQSRGGIQKKTVIRQSLPRTMMTTNRNVVGKTGMRGEQSTKYLQEVLKNVSYPISNEIGVGILSFNRLSSIQRLLNSIKTYTNLNQTTIVISDESTDQNVKAWLRNQTGIALLDNQERIGVAGNTNRILRCLERFKYKIILNDDVEILKTGWEELYPKAMQITGYHHFCFRQPGICGATQEEGTRNSLNGIIIQTIQNKPHGAIMAFDQTAFQTVGYFDEGFEPYGMEHVDWSRRISYSGLQPPGYHDVIGSNAYFKIHKDQSAVTNRGTCLKNGRQLFQEYAERRDRIFVPAGPKSEVPGVTIIIPFQIREQPRASSLKTVIKNMKAQKWPKIQIIIVEQDYSSHVNQVNEEGITYYHAHSDNPNQPFIKSRAFNQGVVIAKHDKIIFHDADIIVSSNYVQKIMQSLQDNEAVHLGLNVNYLTKESTENLDRTGRLDVVMSERLVKYFEGGSFGIRKDSFIKIGGFCELFIGYGNEDTEFYDRMSRGCKFHNDRSQEFIHLYHNRSTGWMERHENNKSLEKRLKMQNFDQRLKERRDDLHRRYSL